MLGAIFNLESPPAFLRVPLIRKSIQDSLGGLVSDFVIEIVQLVVKGLDLLHDPWGMWPRWNKIETTNLFSILRAFDNRCWHFFKTLKDPKLIQLRIFWLNWEWTVLGCAKTRFVSSSLAILFMIAPLILESKDEDLWTSWESGYPKRFNSFTVSVTDAGVVSEGPLPSSSTPVPGQDQAAARLCWWGEAYRFWLLIYCTGYFFKLQTSDDWITTMPSKGASMSKLISIPSSSVSNSWDSETEAFTRSLSKSRWHERSWSSTRNMVVKFELRALKLKLNYVHMKLNFLRCRLGTWSVRSPLFQRSNSTHLSERSTWVSGSCDNNYNYCDLVCWKHLIFFLGFAFALAMMLVRSFLGRYYSSQWDLETRDQRHRSNTFTLNLCFLLQQSVSVRSAIWSSVWNLKNTPTSNSLSCSFFTACFLMKVSVSFPHWANNRNTASLFPSFHILRTSSDTL